MGRSGAARRRSRKRRAEGRPPRRPAEAAPAVATAPAPAPAPAPPRAAPAVRPGHRRALERPPAPWHPVPVTEIFMLAGLVSFFAGLGTGHPAPLVVGIVLLLLATLELTAREHFSGFKSHSLVLALIVTVAVEAVLHFAAGTAFTGPVTLAVVVPVYAALFFLFRGRFRESRDARSIGR